MTTELAPELLPNVPACPSSPEHGVQPDRLASPDLRQPRALQL